MKINKYTTCLIRDRTIKYNAEKLDSSTAVREVLCKLFHADRLPTERFWQICLNSQLEAVGAFENASGGAAFCMADVASIARNALLTGAYGVVIAHNHPSGCLEPSSDDFRLTSQTKQALALLGIQLVDHVIITSGGYYSFKENREL